MSKFLLDIPEELHDKLRIEKVKTKIDINDIIIQVLEETLED